MLAFSFPLEGALREQVRERLLGRKGNDFRGRQEQLFPSHKPGHRGPRSVSWSYAAVLESRLFGRVWWTQRGIFRHVWYVRTLGYRGWDG